MKTKTGYIILLILFAQLNALAQVSFYKKTENSRYLLYAISSSYAPVMLNVSLDSLNLEVGKLIPSKGDTLLMLDLDQGFWTEETDISPWVSAVVNLGDPDARADNFQYQLPFANGSSFECIQGFNGKFSHRSEASKYAVDFKMPVGTPIHAARGGVIIFTKEDSNVGGNNRDKYINQANKIMILHEDGTIGNYVHLVQNGVVVEEGDQVETGQLIGYSGNTGFTTTPHLHFVVRVFKDATRIRFKDINGSPRKGRNYSH